MNRLLLVLCLLLAISVGPALGDEIVNLVDGRQALLKDDGTWKHLDSPPVPSDSEPETKNEAKQKPAIKAKYADEAVEVWDRSLELGEVNYRNSVKLFIHYKNNTDKTVVGISTHVKVINPFGETVLENTYNDETSLAPLERIKSDSFWHFDENQFLRNQPYNKMWQMAQNGTGKIITKVMKVIFDDGTVLVSKNASAPAKKKTVKKPAKGEVL